jgi:hypothetical protein
MQTFDRITEKNIVRGGGTEVADVRVQCRAFMMEMNLLVR